jgi:hypothetical protein
MGLVLLLRVLLLLLLLAPRRQHGETQQLRCGVRWSAKVSCAACTCTDGYVCIV